MKYKKIANYKYELVENDFIIWDAPDMEEVDHLYFSINRLTPDMVKITARAGYAWDGASGPTIDTRNTMRASLFHDVLCQCIRMGLISKDQKRLADKIFKGLLRQDGMCWFRSIYYYRAVRVFGWLMMNSKKENNITVLTT